MQIEVGKRYVRRDGTVSSTIVRGSGEWYPFKDVMSMQTYTDTGCVLSVTEHRDADLVAEYIEPVSPSEVSGKEITVDYDLSGIPDGYAFVGYRIVKEGDLYVSDVGGYKVYVADASDIAGNRLQVIVQPIVPPEPKQRTVAIHKWMVADKAGKECIRFGTAEWVRNCKFKIVVDLGLYEEVKVSV